MRRAVLSLAALVLTIPAVWGYVEAPHSLGQVVAQSSHIVLVEVMQVNKDRNLIIYKKVQDLKGKHPTELIKHNIGKNGFHPREWQTVMAWAEPGKRAVFFHNGGASETCIGTYWYQCYNNGEWWGMSHGEPFLLRSYYGEVDKLSDAVGRMLKGEEVIVTCLADGNKAQLHERKGKLQRLRASLKRQDYNAKRDFVAWGGDGEEVEEFKTHVVLAESAPGWKFLPAALAREVGDRWKLPDFDDASWRTGKAPIGYGEEELKKRGGSVIAEQGQPFLFRRAFDLPEELVRQKGAIVRISVASDDSAVLYLNGELVDQDTEDHEFLYWNREIELQPGQVKPGRNVLAAAVKNNPTSSDLYFDLEVSVQVPLPKKTRPTLAANTDPKATSAATPRVVPDEKPGPGLSIDAARRTLTIACTVAPRKLPNLDKVYPIEVIATYPAPRGQKAHETLVTFQELKPSHVHKALERLGLKAGQPARGEGARAAGPEVKIALEVPGPDAKPLRLPLEKVLVDTRTGQPPPPLTWHFTGSAFKQPDPEKDDQLYGADLTGTLLALFPVTDDTVFQTQLTLKEEAQMKLEVNPAFLPKEGTPVKLIIEVK